MTTDRPRSNALGVVVTVVAAIAAFVVFRTAVPRVIAAIRDGRRPTYERALMAAIAEQGGTAEFQKWAGQLSPGNQAFTAGVLLGRRGLRRLSPSDQLLRLQVVTRRMHAASEAECGPIARGTVTPGQGAAYISSMEPADLQAFTGVVARAMLAEIRTNPPPVEATPADQAAFLSHLESQLTPADVQRFDATAAAIATASDADACWLNRVLYDAAVSAEEPDRARWVLVITTLEAGLPPPAAQPR